MNFILIETFCGAEYAIVVTDEQGSNLVFETKELAEQEAGNCQSAIVVEVP